MVGIYCAFLALEKKAMRRSENMSVLTVVPKQADLTEVMSLITGQLRELANGITVMDVKNATPANLINSIDAVPVIVEEKTVNIPFKQTYPRVACVLGDAVSQAVIGGCRPTHSALFCRCCFCNQGTVKKKSTVYDVRSELLLHNLGKFFPPFLLFVISF
jgi:hypothetical protein